ncbi:hypothetical protein HMPREF3150_03302 [Pseudomonas aeruginosa]|nr:hypothetical protein HMPREF3150_03302 [Pseudomonas aeruginosa]
MADTACGCIRPTGLRKRRLPLQLRRADNRSRLSAAYPRHRRITPVALFALRIRTSK